MADDFYKKSICKHLTHLFSSKRVCPIRLDSIRQRLGWKILFCSALKHIQLSHAQGPASSFCGRYDNPEIPSFHLLLER